MSVMVLKKHKWTCLTTTIATHRVVGCGGGGDGIGTLGGRRAKGPHAWQVRCGCSCFLMLMILTVSSLKCGPQRALNLAAFSYPPMPNRPTEDTAVARWTNRRTNTRVGCIVLFPYVRRGRSQRFITITRSSRSCWWVCFFSSPGWCSVGRRFARRKTKLFQCIPGILITCHM